jgi:drug/metabolite transporter (DMT)-like permease
MMKPIHFGVLLVLGAIWGASFTFIGVAVAEFGPLILMFLRVLIGGLILSALAYGMQPKHRPAAQLQMRARWRRYLSVGLLGSALPFYADRVLFFTVTSSLNQELVVPLTRRRVGV